MDEPACDAVISGSCILLLMRSYFFSLALVLSTVALYSQQTFNYHISFERAVHHEADVEIVYQGLEPGEFRMRMSRSSPGRYAVHEFAKNIYGLQVFNGNDEVLEFERPNPHEWVVSGHDGTIRVRYTLFANHADGTYAQIDESHAHLNIPASFVYAPDYMDRPIEIEIQARVDLFEHPEHEHTKELLASIPYATATPPRH